MGKLLFWFIIILAVLFAARLITRSTSKSESPGKLGSKPAEKPNMVGAEAMVRCQHCGIHMPRSEAYLSDGETWCGPDHARLGHRQS